MFVGISTRKKTGLRWAAPLLFFALWLAYVAGAMLAPALREVATLDWGAPARAEPAKRALVGGLRLLLLGVLVGGRFGPRTLAWAGWALAAWLWWHGRQRERERRALTQRTLDPDTPAMGLDQLSHDRQP